MRDQDKVHLILSYFSCLCFIPLFTVKDSPFVKFHAKQGFMLFIASFVLSLAYVIAPIGCLCTLGLMGVSVVAMMKAFRGERWRVPVLADLADKIDL